MGMEIERERIDGVVRVLLETFPGARVTERKAELSALSHEFVIIPEGARPMVFQVAYDTFEEKSQQELEADVAQAALRLGPDEHYRLMPDRALLSISGPGNGGEL